MFRPGAAVPASEGVRICAAGALLALWLAGCLPPSSTGGGLHFTTIEQKNDAAYTGHQQYNALDPGLLVFFDEAAAAAHLDLFSDAARDLVARVDWRTQFVVAVFQGWQNGAGYGVTIERIAVDGTALRVHAVFRTPEEPGGPVTSPYHLVAVRRPLAAVEGLSFELVVGEGVVLTLTPAPR
ncbi:MAG TPA: protease complex subunit PrcB family protein [Anaerolineales bacterium]|nr:protease complex subunit PrcB family protein [Anaerolineales bacterium]